MTVVSNSDNLVSSNSNLYTDFPDLEYRQMVQLDGSEVELEIVDVSSKPGVSQSYLVDTNQYFDFAQVGVDLFVQRSLGKLDERNRDPLT